VSLRAPFDALGVDAEPAQPARLAVAEIEADNGDALDADRRRRHWRILSWSAGAPLSAAPRDRLAPPAARARELISLMVLAELARFAAKWWTEPMPQPEWAE
jgi:hypothetical protein